MLLNNPKWKDLSSRQIAAAANVGKTLVNVVRDAQVSARPTESDKGGTVMGKDGKSYPAENKKKEKPAKVESGSLAVLKDISKLYAELPRDPEEAVTEMSIGGECLSAGRAGHMGWWLNAYTKIIQNHTEDEDTVIDIPEVAQ